MKGGARQKGHAALLMHSERHLDPSKPCAQLKEDQKEVEDAKDQNDRYSTDVHFKNPSPLFLNRDLYGCWPCASVNIAMCVGRNLHIFEGGYFDLSGEDLCLRSLA